MLQKYYGNLIWNGIKLRQYLFYNIGPWITTDFYAKFTSYIISLLKRGFPILLKGEMVQPGAGEGVGGEYSLRGFHSSFESW